MEQIKINLKLEKEEWVIHTYLMIILWGRFHNTFFIKTQKHHIEEFLDPISSMILFYWYFIF